MQLFHKNTCIIHKKMTKYLCISNIFCTFATKIVFYTKINQYY